MEGAQPTTISSLISARGRTIELNAGVPLFFEGDRSESVYACLEGRIRVFVTLPSGRELVIGMRLPGDVFGELSAIDHRPRSASAVAIGPSVVAHMPGHRFLAEVEREPALAGQVLRSLTAQLRRANARLQARSGESALLRTGHMLTELALVEARDGVDGSPVELRITQYDVAEWIGATREAAARALAQLRRRDVVRTARGRVIIPDVGLLIDTVETL